MKTNTRAVAKPPVFTPEAELRRAVLSCLLWEHGFLESGVDIASRIDDLADACAPMTVSALAIEARKVHGLRHVSLWLCLALLRKEHSQLNCHTGLFGAHTIAEVISRPDELTELVSLYWKNGKRPLPSQMKKGLARAFQKFSGYQLAKYNTDSTIRLRDVLFLCHAKPKDQEQAEVWKRLVGKKLSPPDTWESALAGGANKRETFTRLIEEGKLGYLALLRNLRGMTASGVSESLIKSAIMARKGAGYTLPFQYMQAAVHAPQFEAELDQAMIESLKDIPKLKGRTVIVVDVSGSMGVSLSRAEMSRLDAATALAAVIRGVCEDPVIYATAGSDERHVHATAMVPARNGRALMDAIKGMRYTVGTGGIFLTQVMRCIQAQETADIDRVIVITDEQDCAVRSEDMPSKALPLGKTRYMVNVGVERNGIAHRAWTHIDGFSASVVRYIEAIERV